MFRDWWYKRRFSIPVFYKELLTEFQTYSLRPTDSKVNIQEKSLWFNRSIRVGGKTVFNNGMYQAGIKMINDFTREDGSIMSLSEIKIITPRVKAETQSSRSCSKWMRVPILKHWAEVATTARCVKKFRLRKLMHKLTCIWIGTRIHLAQCMKTVFQP